MGRYTQVSEIAYQTGYDSLKTEETPTSVHPSPTRVIIKESAEIRNFFSKSPLTKAPRACKIIINARIPAGSVEALYSIGLLFVKYGWNV